MTFGLSRSACAGRLVAALLIVVGALAGAGQGSAQMRTAPDSFADLAEDLLDSVVNISSSQRVAGTRGLPVPEVPEGSPFQEFFEDFFDRERPGQRTPRRLQSLGSGFVVDPSGYIVTNNHVIAEADEINVNFADGRTLLAEVVGRDPKTDIALLKVEATQPLKAARFGDSGSLRIGEWVMAIGNPFGFGGTVTVGIVSALDRDINSGPYDRFIQTDASINRGNSGGPLFNLEGEVIGINTAIISPTGGSIGIGFAVPSEIAIPVIQQLQEFGETRRGWLGVRIQEVTDDLAESLGMGEAKGALVAGITQDGPAEMAGLEPGDVIVEFDGSPIATMRELPRIVADTPVGKRVQVTVVRRGESMNVEVELGRLEEGEQLVARLGEDDPELDETTTEETLGLTLEVLSDDARAEHDIADEVQGVLVAEVDPNGSAAQSDIRPGDVIVEVGQEPVSTPADVAARLRQLQEDGRRSALLLVAGRDNDLRFVAVRIDGSQ